MIFQVKATPSVSERDMFGWWTCSVLDMFSFGYVHLVSGYPPPLVALASLQLIKVFQKLFLSRILSAYMNIFRLSGIFLSNIFLLWVWHRNTARLHFWLTVRYLGASHFERLVRNSAVLKFCFDITSRSAVIDEKWPKMQFFFQIFFYPE